MNKTTMKIIPAAALTALIMLLSWYGRSLQRVLREFLGYSGLLAFVCVSFLIFIFLVTRFFSLRKGVLGGLIIFYPLGIWYLRANPEEAVHLIEYGTFALVLSWSFGFRMNEAKNLAYSFSIASFVGYLDELFQKINPERVYDLRDILINVIGAALALLTFKLQRQAN